MRISFLRILQLSIVLSLGLGHSLALAKDRSLQEIVEASFGAGIQLEENRWFLTPEHLRQIQEDSGVPIRERILSYFKVHLKEKLLGYAYIDTHRVRSKNETLVIMINKDQTLRRVEIARFLEPLEYKPPQDWLNQFNGVSSPNFSALVSQTTAITGATMSVKAVREAVAKIMSSHKLLSRSSEG